MGRRQRAARAQAEARTRPQTAAPSRPAIPWNTWAWLTAVTVVAYLPALRGGFIWDDDVYVEHNLTLRSLRGLLHIWINPGATPQYYPLVHSSFWLEYHLWGLQPFGFHLVNVLMHAATAFLVFLVLRRLEVAGAAFVAALFALHPVHVESVAWITERKNVLSALLYMASLLTYLRFAGIGGPPPERRSRVYALALAFFVGALLSKTVVASLPAAALLILWWKRGRVEPRDVRPLVPFFILGITLGLATAYIEKHHVGARGLDWALTPVERILVAGRAVWFYAGKLVWPHPLTFVYPRWAIDAGSVAAYAFPMAAVAAVAAFAYGARRLGRGPLVALLFFGGTLVPALGFFDVYPMRYSFVADHFQYVASLGLLTLIGATATWLSARMARPARLGAAIVVLAVFGALTFRQTHIYADRETLWLDTIAKNPGAWMAYHNLGGLREQQGRDAEALELYAAALRLKPDFGDVLNNMGNVYARQGRDEEAMRSYTESLRLLPDQAEAHSNLGALLAARGRVDEAMRHYEDALRILPHFAGAHINMGNAFVLKGRPADAIPYYERALAFAPDDAGAHYNLGNALLALGRSDEALAELDAALRLRPGYAKAQAARARALAGRDGGTR
jgi:tetratricopeptide (TPR) repeat protein